jgi:hypothetical protein
VYTFGEFTFKAVRSNCKQFFFRSWKSDTGIFMRLWNVKNVGSTVLITMKPLVSKLTIPHASPLYHTGNNIFMKYN